MVQSISADCTVDGGMYVVVWSYGVVERKVENYSRTNKYSGTEGSERRAAHATGEPSGIYTDVGPLLTAVLIDSGLFVQSWGGISTRIDFWAQRKAPPCIVLTRKNRASYEARITEPVTSGLTVSIWRNG